MTPEKIIEKVLGRSIEEFEHPIDHSALMGICISLGKIHVLHWSELSAVYDWAFGSNGKGDFRSLSVQQLGDLVELNIISEKLIRKKIGLDV
jgi:hypothetical protein